MSTTMTEVDNRKVYVMAVTISDVDQLKWTQECRRNIALQLASVTLQSLAHVRTPYIVHAHTLQEGVMEDNTGCIPPHYLLNKSIDLAQHAHSLMTIDLGMKRLLNDKNLEVLRAGVAAVIERTRVAAMQAAKSRHEANQAKKRRISKGQSPLAVTGP